MSEKPLPCPVCGTSPELSQLFNSVKFYCGNRACLIYGTHSMTLEGWNSLPRHTALDLTAAYERGRKDAQEWVSIVKRAPKEGWYLASNEGWGVCIARFHRSGRWYNTNGNHMTDRPPTHWLPLPAPPKEEKL